MKQFSLDVIKNKRLNADKTLQEMAQSMGMKNASTYLKYETGLYAFKAEQLPLLAKSLGCKITDFFV